MSGSADKHGLRKINKEILCVYQSEVVFNAVYESYWYNPSESYKLCTRMIIMRAQRPVKITAGRSRTLSLPLLASVNVEHANYS
jgi:hypothetical protein